MEKMTMTDSTIAFIGLGLIGGSIARAIRKTRPDIRIMAYMRSRSRLEQARKEGIVDVILDGIDENLRECDGGIGHGHFFHIGISSCKCGDRMRRIKCMKGMP